MIIEIDKFFFIYLLIFLLFILQLISIFYFKSKLDERPQTYDTKDIMKEIFSKGNRFYPETEARALIRQRKEKN
jgi:hypothetical protein